MTKQQAKQKIKKLIEKYEKLTSAQIKKYNEANTRKDFIMPLFHALGWDVYNEFSEREVIEEDTGVRGLVDYSFQIKNISAFLLEAKALKVDLDKIEWARQSTSYGWNRGISWVVLCDFEGLKVFNSEWEVDTPRPNLELTYKEYLEKFDDLWLLSKESFEKQILDKQAEKFGIKSKRSKVGEKLAEDLVKWREQLFENFRQYNPILSEQNLDEAVQRVLDRFIFIRTCEDRKIEEKTLWPELQRWIKNSRKPHNFLQYLRPTFEKFDKKYNSNLFHKHICDGLDTGGEAFEEIIKDLYEDVELGVKYDFKAINSDVLGSIYEQYLGHLLIKEKKKNGQASKTKRKSQGIYYTPTFIVDYIVQNTLGKIIKEKKNLKEIENLKILDPACGSGSFLIKAFDVMNENLKKYRPDAALRKYQILTQNIYGVDLDEQAVEIARLNLMLKAVEKDRKLPLLSENIKAGNSLISGNEKELEKYFGKNWKDKKPFNWAEEFNATRGCNPLLQGERYEQGNQNKQDEQNIQDLQAYHITWVTHNSRVSERMVEFGVKKDDPFLLDGREEIEITQYIAQIVREDNLRVLSYNICRDHIHMFLVCEEDDRDNIVRKLKGKSTQLYKENHNIRDKFNLWAQKYSWTYMKDKEQFGNTIEYILHNREKHNLPSNKGLQPLVADMCISVEQSFMPAEEQGGFDVIVGNPPWVSLKGKHRTIDFSKEELKYLLNTFKADTYRPNLFEMFIWRSLSLLKENGIFSFIVPDRLCSNRQFIKLRKYILEKFSVEKLWFKVNFPGIIGDTIIFVIRKKNPKENQIEIAEYPSSDFNSVPQTFFSNIEDKSLFYIPSKIYKIFKEVINKSKRLNYIVFSSVGFIAKSGKVTKSKKSKSQIKVLKGENITRYMQKGNYFFEFKKANLVGGTQDKDKLEEPFKIFVRKTGIDLYATFSEEGLYPEQSLYFLYGADRQTLLFLLAILNSKLLNVYYQNFAVTNRDATPQLKKMDLDKFPIILGNKNQKSKLAILADKMLKLNKDLQDTSENSDEWYKIKKEIEETDKIIDQEVYKLYGLTEEEIKIIESEYKRR